MRATGPQLVRRGRAEAEEFEVGGDHLEQHVRADLVRAAARAGRLEQRRDLLLHHHFADERRAARGVPRRWARGRPASCREAWRSPPGRSLRDRWSRRCTCELADNAREAVRRDPPPRPGRRRTARARRRLPPRATRRSPSRRRRRRRRGIACRRNENPLRAATAREAGAVEHVTEQRAIGTLQDGIARAGDLHRRAARVEHGRRWSPCAAS